MALLILWYSHRPAWGKVGFPSNSKFLAQSSIILMNYNQSHSHTMYCLLTIPDQSAPFWASQSTILKIFTYTYSYGLVRYPRKLFFFFFAFFFPSFLCLFHGLQSTAEHKDSTWYLHKQNQNQLNAWNHFKVINTNKKHDDPLKY